MTIRQVTTASNLATVNGTMVSGDVMRFAKGTYTLSTGLVLVNGCSYIGDPGAIISAGAAVDLFRMDSGTANNIYVSGFTFDETNFQSPNAVCWISGNTGGINAGAHHLAICNNTFQNIAGTTGSIYAFQGDNLRFDNNVFQNVYQPVSIHNNDTLPHQNISVCGNTFHAVNRFTVEVQCLNAPYNHLHVNNNFAYDSTNTCLSIVDNSRSAVDVTCNFNTFFLGVANIEMANSNMTVTGNTFTNCSGCLQISSCQNSVIVGNTFRGCATANLYGQDGGYAQNQYIGNNAVDGAIVFGNVGGTFGTATTASNGFAGGFTFPLPDYAPQTFAGLESLLADAGAAGRITPQVMRNLLTSLAGTQYLSSALFP